MPAAKLEKIPANRTFLESVGRFFSSADTTFLGLLRADDAVDMHI